MTRPLALLFGLLPLVATAQPIDPILLGGSPGAAARLEEIDAELEQSFERVLSRYDAEIAAQPYRVMAQIERCNFVEAFPAQYEGAVFSDEVYERGALCEQDLVARLPDHPEVRLWQLGRTYGDEERLAAGQELLALLDMHGWTRGQRARLYVELANVSERLDTERRFRVRTAEYARRALEQDIRADVRLILGAHFHDIGDRAAALEALTSPFDGHDPQDNWYRVRKMAYLAQFDERAAVVALHAELDDSSYYDRTEAAAALRAVGEHARAQAELGDDAASDYGTDDDRQRFMLSLETGSADEALAAYESWRDAGFWEDPIGINRFALFVAHPELPWRGRDWLGFAGALALLASVVLVWCVPLGLVHYRGLVNRVRGTMPLRDGGLGLRDAWLGLAAFSVPSFIALYTIGPFDAFSDEMRPWVVIAEQSQLAELLIAESLLTIVLLVAAAHVLRRHFVHWWTVDWSLGKCVAVGVAAGLVFRVPMLLTMVSGVDLDAALRVDNAMWQSLTEVDELYGAAAALWVLSVAAPVGEAFIFRGVLLRACLRHVSFPVANGVQALLFAAMHFDLSALPFLFAFGLAAGWLARVSGGLLAPMLMHSVLNLVAGLLITD
jgi:membrane protease YdiL (CAAX protease family)